MKEYMVGKERHFAVNVMKSIAKEMIAKSIHI
jgi:hypothetical protein